MSPTFIRTLVLGVGLSLSAAACGGEGSTETTSDTGGIATLADDSTDDQATGADQTETSDDGATGSAEAPDDPELAYARYDDCMADLGFDFSTAIVGEDGGLSVDDQALDVDDPQAQSFDSDDDFGAAFDEANAACEKHLANIDDDFDLDPEQQALMNDAQLQWAACMRAQGIDLPDMDASAGGVTVIEINPEDGDPQSGGELGGDDFDFEAFEKADQECASAFDALNESLESTEGEG